MKNSEAPTKLITDKVRAQIMTIRDTGLTNMFSVRNVQLIASVLGMWELTAFLSKHKEAYLEFILTGKEI